jgi:hypothetical protein
LTVSVTGPVDLSWTLRREGEAWSLWSGADATADTSVSIPADIAWRVWTKSLDTSEARNHIATSGDRGAADALVEFVAIMA